MALVMNTLFGHIILILITNNLIYHIGIVANSTEINDALKTSPTTQLPGIGTLNYGLLTRTKNKEQRNVTGNEMPSTKLEAEIVTIKFLNKNTLPLERDSSSESKSYTSVGHSDTSTYNPTSSASSDVDNYQTGSNLTETQQVNNIHEMKTNNSDKEFMDFILPSGLQEYRDNENSSGNHTFDVFVTVYHQQNGPAAVDLPPSTTKSVNILSEDSTSNSATENAQKVASTSSFFHIFDGDLKTTTGESPNKYNKTTSPNAAQVTESFSSVESTSLIKGITSESSSSVQSTSLMKGTTSHSTSSVRSTSLIRGTTLESTSSVQSTSYNGTTSDSASSVQSTSLTNENTRDSASSIQNTSRYGSTSELSLHDTTTILIPGDSVLENNDAQESTGNLHKKITSMTAVTTSTSSLSKSETITTGASEYSSLFLSHEPRTTMRSITSDHITMQATAGDRSSNFVSLGQESTTTTSQTYVHINPSLSTTKHVKTDNPELVTNKVTNSTFEGKNKTDRQDTTTSMTLTKNQPTGTTTNQSTGTTTHQSTGTTTNQSTGTTTNQSTDTTTSQPTGTTTNQSTGTTTNQPTGTTTNQSTGTTTNQSTDTTTSQPTGTTTNQSTGTTTNQPTGTTTNQSIAPTTSEETSEVSLTFELTKSKTTATPTTKTTAKQSVTKFTVTSKSTNQTTYKANTNSTVLNNYFNTTQSSITDGNESVQSFKAQEYTDKPAIYQHTSTANTSQEVDMHPQEIDDGDDTYWPIAVALTVGVPVIIVLGVTITVLHRKRLGRPSRLTTSSFFT